MLSLLGIIEQCLKTGKKQHWRKASLTNICVGLLAGFKVLYILLLVFSKYFLRLSAYFFSLFQALLSFRLQTLGQDILGLAQSIFLVGNLLIHLLKVDTFSILKNKEHSSRFSFNKLETEWKDVVMIYNYSSVICLHHCCHCVITLFLFFC